MAPTKPRKPRATASQSAKIHASRASKRLKLRSPRRSNQMKSGTEDQTPTTDVEMHLSEDDIVVDSDSENQPEVHRGPVPHLTTSTASVTITLAPRQSLNSTTSSPKPPANGLVE
ncbi:hypothetical protein K3495_g6514 [Podosphaera aphanis]|nr:hypothetical protein K3495_g6514 [Podosphaera aphanis]